MELLKRFKILRILFTARVYLRYPQDFKVILFLNSLLFAKDKEEMYLFPDKASNSISALQSFKSAEPKSK